MPPFERIRNKLNSSYKLFLLTENASSGIRLMFYYFWLPILRRLGLKKEFNVKLNLTKFGRSFTFYATDESDLGTLKEIFIDEEYRLQLPDSPKVVFDLGSNVGLSVIYFRLVYPEAIIYAFEPDPRNINKLKKNISQFDNIILMPYAISDINGTTLFYANTERGVSSSLIARPSNKRTIEIENRTLDMVMSDLKISFIDLIKFDIEGAELMAFRGFTNLNNTRNLIGELHLDLIDGTEADFAALFDKFTLTTRIISSKRRIFEARHA